MQGGLGVTSPYRRPGATDDTTPDERIGPRSKFLATCPTCGVLLIAESPTDAGLAILTHAKTCGQRPPDDFLRITAELHDDPLGVHMLEVTTRERSMRVQASFRLDPDYPDEVEATLHVSGEPSPDEMAGLLAWCRSRWRPPAWVARMRMTFRQG